VSCLFVLYASLFFLIADIRHLRRFVRDDRFSFLLYWYKTKQLCCNFRFLFFLLYPFVGTFSLRSHLYLPEKANLINLSARFHFFCALSFIHSISLYVSVSSLYLSLFVCLFYVSFFCTQVNVCVCTG
jgi:hypothetical protein